MTLQDQGGTILLVGLSPALGRVITLSELVPGAVNRAAGYLEVAAGKATNAARVAVELGRPAVLITPLGEENSDLFTALAASDGILLEIVPHPGRIRWAVTLVEESAAARRATEIVVNEPTPVPATVATEILNRVRSRIGSAAACVLAGSRLADIPPELPLQIANASRAAEVPLFIDLRGAELLRLLDSAAASPEKPPAKPPEKTLPGENPRHRLVVKINEEEFRDTAQQAGIGESVAMVETAGAQPAIAVAPTATAPLDVRELQRFARRFGCTLVVSRGRASTLYADPSGRAGEVPVPQVAVRNPIGSGDTLLAALAVQLTDGASLAEAVNEAVKLASRNATLLRPGTIIGP